ncbi:hypothetical protein IFM89_022557, partial [Coptis chinensis]
ALVKLGYWVFGLGGGGYGSGVFVSRRDGSLAGREVVVEKRRFKEREGKKKGFNFKVPINPLSPSRDVVKLGSEAALRRPQKHALEGEKLPKWWPDFVPASLVVSGNDNQELQKEANRAFEMQGKRTEARMELLKICIILQIFPPQESSPEMEMVARGLKTHLRVEQRELMLNLLTGICGPASKSGVEALGLINRPLVEDDMWHLTS